MIWAIVSAVLIAIMKRHGHGVICLCSIGSNTTHHMCHGYQSGDKKLPKSSV
jgi:hypothetical protein